jgi:hypothetical protein
MSFTFGPVYREEIDVIVSSYGGRPVLVDLDLALKESASPEVQLGFNSPHHSQAMPPPPSMAAMTMTCYSAGIHWNFS